MKIGYYHKIPHILIFYSSPHFTRNMKNEKKLIGTTLGVKLSKKERESTTFTHQKYHQYLPGVVLGTYFLKKINRYPSTNKQSLPSVDFFKAD
jgi:hypothetical protein